LAAANREVCYIGFSRNFGKEAATSAGLHFATGDAAIVIDADLQHPTVLIPKFIEAWEKGAEVVIGLRTKNESQSFMKSIGSFFYYKIINFISQTPIVKGATDFRLVDRRVIDEFNKFSEHERITRGLIDWLGFRRQFVEFEADKRAHGAASYSYLKLIKLAISSSIAHSLIPLKLAGYLGIFIFITTGIGGLAIFIQRYIFADALGWHISGTAQLAVLIIFFIGIVLSCLGLIALYIGNIYSEVLGRPLYVIRTKVNIKEK
jgi:dolichol-phosphate mannosyltransferase